MFDKSIRYVRYINLNVSTYKFIKISSFCKNTFENFEKLSTIQLTNTIRICQKNQFYKID